MDLIWFFFVELLANSLNSGEEVPNSVPELVEGSTIPSIMNTGTPTVNCATPDMLGHSRNSSSTSQMSKASGYSTQHSRQSSSGDSVGHIRFVFQITFLFIQRFFQD